MGQSGRLCRRAAAGLGRRDQRDAHHEENGGDSEPDRRPQAKLRGTRGGFATSRPNEEEPLGVPWNPSVPRCPYDTKSGPRKRQAAGDEERSTENHAGNLSGRPPAFRCKPGMRRRTLRSHGLSGFPSRKTGAVSARQSSKKRVTLKARRRNSDPQPQPPTVPELRDAGTLPNQEAAGGPRLMARPAASHFSLSPSAPLADGTRRIASRDCPARPFPPLISERDGGRAGRRKRWRGSRSGGTGFRRGGGRPAELVAMPWCPLAGSAEGDGGELGGAERRG